MPTFTYAPTRHGFRNRHLIFSREVRTTLQRREGEANAREKWSTLRNLQFTEGTLSFGIPDFESLGRHAL